MLSLPSLLVRFLQHSSYAFFYQILNSFQFSIRRTLRHYPPPFFDHEFALNTNQQYIDHIYTKPNN